MCTFSFFSEKFNRILQCSRYREYDEIICKVCIYKNNLLQSDWLIRLEKKLVILDNQGWYRPFYSKNMGAAIIDFRMCPPLVKCQNLLFSGFIDTLMYGFSRTGVTIYCYFGLKFNDNTCCEVICKRRYNDNDIMTTNKLPGMYFFFNYCYIPHTKSV